VDKDSALHSTPQSSGETAEKEEEKGDNNQQNLPQQEEGEEQQQKKQGGGEGVEVEEKKMDLQALIDGVLFLREILFRSTHAINNII